MTESPTATLDLELLPARHGDAILVSWGDADDRHRLLVDGGPASAYPDIRQWFGDIAAPGPIDLMVMTHIDNDHIEGSILLVNDADLALDIKEIWFNGPAQLSPELGPAEGEMFAALIHAREIPWNAAFGGDAVRSDSSDLLPVHELPGGLRLTVLGPDRQALLKLRDKWWSAGDGDGFLFDTAEQALAALRSKPKLNPADTYLSDQGAPDVYELARQVSANDDSPSNGSSIVLLAEYGDVSVLLSGDATPGSLGRGVGRLLRERGVERLDLTAYKLPHHGSARNATRDVLKPLPAHAYLFSSSGGSHGRPHAAAVARCLEYGNPAAHLVFNYRTPATLLWNDTERVERSRYHPHYPVPESSGIRLQPSAMVTT
jgi:glyoxylase-like metal-dependent hydrolase (beta-lactamase superfamily II)